VGVGNVRIECLRGGGWVSKVTWDDMVGLNWREDVCSSGLSRAEAREVVWKTRTGQGVRESA